MDTSTVQFALSDSVAYITLNRPEAMNSLHLEMAKDLLASALQCDETSSVRAVVLSGAGAYFCAGGDVKTFGEQEERLPSYVKEITTYLHAAISTLTRMNAPVIAAVEGVAAGGGLSLACAADLVIAGEATRFTSAYTRIGLSPDGSLTYILPRLVGVRRAMEMILTNRTLTAQEARDWGIVTKVVPDGQAREQAEALARQLAAGPTLAFGAAKRLIHQSTTESLETQMMAESQSIAAMSGTHDGREGIIAFVAKRKPTFEGK